MNNDLGSVWIDMVIYRLYIFRKFFRSMCMARALSRSRCWAVGLLKFQDSRVDGYMAICFGSYGAHIYSTVALSGVGPCALQ